MDGNYGITSLVEKKGKLNETEFSEYERSKVISMHEWTEEEFPYQKYFSWRSDSLFLNRDYPIKNK